MCKLYRSIKNIRVLPSMTYDNRTDALTGKFEKSNYYQLLNGTWKFFFADSYKDLPANITDPFREHGLLE